MTTSRRPATVGSKDVGSAPAPGCSPRAGIDVSIANTRGTQRPGVAQPHRATALGASRTAMLTTGFDRALRALRLSRRSPRGTHRASFLPIHPPVHRSTCR